MEEKTMLRIIKTIINSKHLNYAEQICEIKLLFHVEDCNKKKEKPTKVIK